ncbi:MAG: ABC transporter permease [Clostridia bacterium]|nr:ABC transporter permease [Clostridia bacterium]
MKLSSIRYLNKEGVRNLWVNRLMTFASVGVLTACMVLMGCCISIILNMNNQLQLVQDQNTVVLFIESGTSNERISEIEDEIIEIGNIKNIQFKSSEEALEEIKAGVDEQYRDAYDLLDADTLPDSFVVTVRDIGNNDETVAKLKQIRSIESTLDNREYVESLKHIRNIVTGIGLGVVIILFVVSFFIVYNTVSVTIYNRRLEIQIMRCVGATKKFICYPFIVEGVFIGIISTAVSLILVYVIYFSVTSFMKLDDIVPFSQMWGILLLSFIVIGVFTGVIASGKSVGKYLKKEGGEVFNG